MTTLPEHPQSAEFQEAAAGLHGLAKRPSNHELLEFYGLYKVGRHGKNITPQPWTKLSMEGQKWESWTKYSKKGITPEEAQAEYVEKYNAIKEAQNNASK